MREEDGSRYERLFQLQEQTIENQREIAETQKGIMVTHQQMDKSHQQIAEFQRGQIAINRDLLSLLRTMNESLGDLKRQV